MSSFWHWFVIAGVVGSLIAMIALLFGNRKTSGEKTTGHNWDGITELDNPLPMWWVGMFVGTVIFAVPFLIYFPGLGDFEGAGDWSSAGQHDRDVERNIERFRPLYAELGQLSESELHADPRARQIGRRLYINHCSTCHGVNAGGAYGFPNLTDSDWIWGEGFGAVRTAITNGRVAAMPAWEAPLGNEGLVQVTQYVLRLSGANHNTEFADEGEPLFQTFCVACHGAEGKGNPLLGAPNLTDNIWLYGGSSTEIKLTLKNGRAGNMPAHDQILDKDQIHVLSGYVTSLSINKDK